MDQARLNYFMKISDHDNRKLSGVPPYLENFIKRCGISELFRPLFVRYLLFRFHRFQLALDTDKYPFNLLDPELVKTPTLNDRNFEELVGSNKSMNLIFFEKDWHNINQNKFENFEKFIKLHSINPVQKIKIKQNIFSKLLGWPKTITTDFSVNAFSLRDLLKGSIFLPSLKDTKSPGSLQFTADFYKMSLVDEFCFLIGKNEILLKSKKPNRRKIISSKSYFNSYKSRKLFIKLLGDNFSGKITRHGGIPSNVFAEEVFIADACDKEFDHKFNKNNFLIRYGGIKTKNVSSALIGLYDQSTFTSRFRTGMTRWQFINEYIPDQRKLFELSKKNDYLQNLIYREPQRSLKPYLQTFDGAKKDSNINIRQSLSEHGLMIVTYDSSLPLFLVENDMPFFLFWRKEHWPFWSLDKYKFLKKSGLYHESPESLNKRLIEFFSNGPTEWRKKYNLAATEYKNFLRSIYVD